MKNRKLLITGVLRQTLAILFFASVGMIQISCGGAQKADIDWFVGEWEGVRTSDDDGHEAPIFAQVVKLHDGPGQLERLEIQTDKGPYVGVAVRVEDKTRGWLMYYGNSSRRSISTLEGTVEPHRATWISIAADGGRSTKVVLERVDSNEVRRINYTSKNRGKTWRVLFTDVLKRTGSTP